MRLKESTALFSGTVGSSRSIYLKSGAILLSLTNLKEITVQLHVNGFQKNGETFHIQTL